MNTRVKLLLAVLALSLCPSAVKAQFKSGYSDLGDSETVTSFKQHVSTISASIMEGRKAGSEGELMTAEYVTEVLNSYGVDVLSGPEGDPFGIRQENGDTLTSRNVCAFIQGGDKSLRNNYIVIGARMDNLGTRQDAADESIHPQAFGSSRGFRSLKTVFRRILVLPEQVVLRHGEH